MSQLTEEQKLRGILDEVVSARSDELKTEFDQRQEELAHKLEAMDSDTKAKLEALAAQPAQPMDLPVPGSDKTVRLYKGYNLDRQCMQLMIIDQDKRDMIARTIIDAITRASLAESSGSVGGYLVPDEFADELLAYARLSSLALNKCRIWPMAGKDLYIPGEDGTVTVVYTDEAVAATQSDPTFRQVQLTAIRLDAFGVMSSEVEADSQIDLVSNVFEQYAQAIAVQLDSDLFVGTSPFTGIKTAGSVVNVGMAGGDTSLDDIDAIYFSEMIGELAVNKIGNSEFYYGRVIGHRARSLADTSGQLIWGSMASAEPASIYGFPYNVSDAFPSDGVSELAVVFGDLKRVALGIRQGMEFSIDPYGLWTSSQIRTKVTMRVAMVVAQPDGLVRLMTAAA